MPKLTDNDYQIPLEQHGQRIDVVLKTLLIDFSRTQCSEWIKQGRITVNHRAVKPKDKVMAGDRIQIPDSGLVSRSLPEVSLPEAIALDIVYEDDALLVVNKQANLVVHPGAGNREHTLVNALLYHDPLLAALPRAGIVHRLDKDTTGLLLVAKTLPVYTKLVYDMQARTIQRRYIALVQGNINLRGEIDTLLNRHPHNRLKMAVCKQGRHAVTRYAVKKPYAFLTLLDIELLTGRTHQIRVHLAHIKHPVLGDPLYGKPVSVPESLPDPLKTRIKSFQRQALHATTLTFNHPLTHQPLTVTATLPDDFQTLLKELDEHTDSFIP